MKRRVKTHSINFFKVSVAMEMSAIFFYQNEKSIVNSTSGNNI